MSGNCRVEAAPRAGRRPCDDRRSIASRRLAIAGRNLFICLLQFSCSSRPFSNLMTFRNSPVPPRYPRTKIKVSSAIDTIDLLSKSYGANLPRDNVWFRRPLCRCWICHCQGNVGGSSSAGPASGGCRPAGRRRRCCCSGCWYRRRHRDSRQGLRPYQGSHPPRGAVSVRGELGSVFALFSCRATLYCSTNESICSHTCHLHICMHAHVTCRERMAIANKYSRSQLLYL